ncbi:MULTISPECIES: LysR substrate-binding domain-containing protein [unclassified Sulfitobacter]|uniref:LysR substrate-binding domain-containing protein n=1 Tax=unclassified Sulfitobacter TaxID=196795 RepID=UPI003745C41B
MATQSRRDLPDMRLLQTFESAARHGNFTRAGDELALTQSAVSRQVRDLEIQIGHPLFERNRGRVITTPKGEAFLQEVTQLLRMAEVTMRHAKAAEGDHKLLTINTLPTFALRWLAPRLAGYLDKDPNTTFDITTRKGVFDLTSEQCDLSIHFGDPHWPSARCVYLCSEIVVPVAGGALLRHPVTRPEDLVAAPKLVLSERTHLWSEWFDRCGVTTPLKHLAHSFDQFTLTIEAAKSGLGYALLPRYLIEKELAAGDLGVVLDAPHATQKAYYLVIPEGREEKVKLFCDWILEQVKFRPLAKTAQSGSSSPL